jgi:hypothetical protein
VSNWSLARGAPRIASVTFESAGNVENVTLLTPAASHTPGAWTELEANMPACEGLLVQLEFGGDSRYLVSLGIGPPGSVVPLIEHIGFNIVSFRNHYPSMVLPLRVPAGTRLWARYQCSDVTQVSPGTPRISVEPIGLSSAMPIGFTRCDTVGVNLATSDGTPIDISYADGGAINEIVASTARACRAVMPSFPGEHANGYLTLFTGAAMTVPWIDRVWIPGAFPAFVSGVGPVIPASLAGGSRIGGRVAFLNSATNLSLILHLFS